MTDSERVERRADVAETRAEHRADAAELRAERRVDVAEARAAVEATAHTLDVLVGLLGRHFRLGVLALVVAVTVGMGLLYLSINSSSTVDTVERQAMVNELAVLRHQVNERWTHMRLCEVALGARLGTETAHTVCLPVLGSDFEALKRKVVDEERKLAGIE